MFITLAVQASQANAASDNTASVIIVTVVSVTGIILLWIFFRFLSNIDAPVKQAERRVARYPQLFDALGKLDKDQVEAINAIRQIMESELETTEKKIRRDSIKIGVVSFLAGGALTFAVTLLVHPLH